MGADLVFPDAVFSAEQYARYLFCLTLKPAANQPVSGTGLAITAFVVAVGALSLLAFIVVKVTAG